MRVESPISPRFIEGFVDQCLKMGMNLEQTEDWFNKHAHNEVLARPHVNAGFREVIAGYDGPVPKSAMARWLTPEVLALAEEIRLHYGDDPMSKAARAELDLPDPSWDTVPDDLRKVASQLSQTLDQFDYLPLNQKLLLAALAGGGIGGMSRAVSPSDEDVMNDRGVLNRFIRGATRGVGTGAGAAAGAAAGSSLARGGLNRQFGQDTRLPAMLLGAGLGGLGGYRLTQ